MPRYFFHTRIRDDVVPDPDGLELRDPDQAWQAARATIRAMMAEPHDQVRLIGACLVVVDAAGDVILEFPFAEAMTPAPGEGPADGQWQ